MSRPDRAIEKLVLGELSAQEAEAMRQDPDVRAREAALLASNEEILRAHPPERIARQIRRRQTTRRAAVVGALATACLALVFVLPSEQTERAKGGPGLAVWRKTQSEPELLKDGAHVRAGDVLQIAYAPRGARYGAIASIDGRGEVTWHMPTTGADAVPLAAEPTTLATAYELDAAPGFERFVFVTSDAPFALRRLAFGPSGPLTLGGGMTLTSVNLVKE